MIFCCKIPDAELYINKKMFVGSTILVAEAVKHYGVLEIVLWLHHNTVEKHRKPAQYKRDPSTWSLLLYNDLPSFTVLI